MIRMKVKLLAYTPDPEKLVAAAAKNCYSSTDVDSVLDGLTEEKTESFVNMLSEIGHESPIEHGADHAPPHCIVLGAEPALCA